MVSSGNRVAMPASKVTLALEISNQVRKAKRRRLLQEELEAESEGDSSHQTRQEASESEEDPVYVGRQFTESLANDMIEKELSAIVGRPRDRRARPVASSVDRTSSVATSSRDPIPPADGSPAAGTGQNRRTAAAQKRK